MFTLPRPKPHAPWYTQSAFKKWIADIFHLTSRKRSYQLLLTPKGPDGDIAWVMHSQRLFFINSDLPTPPAGATVRCDPVTDSVRRAVTLQAITAHEAGHVRHSSRNTNRTALEHYVWNCLEDERMERLMAAEYPQLAAMFTYVGDIIAELGRAKITGKVTEGVLFWRFDHDRPEDQRVWKPAADRAALWAEVRPLVEEAWTTPDAEHVDVLARQIIALLQRHDAQQAAAQAAPPPPPPPSGASGAPGDEGASGSSQGGEPGQNAETGAAPSRDQNASSAPDPDGESSPSDTDGTGADEGEDAGAREGTGGQSLDGDERPTAPDAAGQGDEPPADHPADAGQRGPDQRPDGRGAPESQNAGPGPGTPDEPRGGTLPSLNGTPELESNEHLFILVSASGAASDSDGQDAGEGTEGNVTVLVEGDGPGGQALPEGARVLDLRDPAERGGSGVGSGPALPPPPTEDVVTADTIARNVEGYARMLAPLLHPPTRPDARVRHRSKGRFSYNRYARGDEKVFEHKERGGKPAPIFIDFAIDVSSSMTDTEMQPAREAAVMLVKAAALGKSRARVVTFNTGVEEIINRPMPYLEAAQKIAAIRPYGGTDLSQCLEHLFRSPPTLPDEEHVVVIICDGQLHDWDYASCAAIVREQRRRHVRFIPVLISTAASGDLTQWRGAFGSAVPCQDTASIARMIKTLLTTVRNGLH